MLNPFGLFMLTSRIWNPFVKNPGDAIKGTNEIVKQVGVLQVLKIGKSEIFFNFFFLHFYPNNCKNCLNNLRTCWTIEQLLVQLFEVLDPFYLN